MQSKSVRYGVSLVTIRAQAGASADRDTERTEREHPEEVVPDEPDGTGGTRLPAHRGIL